MIFHSNNDSTNAPQCYVIRTLPVFLIFVVDKITVEQAFYYLIPRLSCVNIIPPTLPPRLRFDAAVTKRTRLRSLRNSKTTLFQKSGAVNRKALHFFSFKRLNPLFTIVCALSVFTFIDISMLSPSCHTNAHRHCNASK